ncbi:hypothetical protein GUJ93_ZPchr0006g41505 [Zizania palustris]|uniref:Uncharacterized protein n=1 Tax=Zizania palustris TaxID=103762 RepID=A0A8J5SZN9_ZIZPA|nr:hypothetical protein GUJ93_ZPchr0006g41505 [Zizania palustris]
MAPPQTHGAGGLRVLRTERVAPAGRELPEKVLPLTYLDAVWLHAQPVERVFFYRLGPGAEDVDAVLSRMVDSLSRALHAFYPLAGRVRRTAGENNRYELFYQPGDSVVLTVAEHDGVGVDELAMDDPREVTKIAQLLPKLPEGGAVLALQVTVLLPERRGLALGVIVHHSACDGVGSTNFLHTWAAACAGAKVTPEPPVIDRTVIRDRKEIHDVFTSPTNDAKELFKSPYVGKLLTTFTLSKEKLQGIKDAVAGEAVRRGVPPTRCTSLIATYGLMWHCLHRSAPESEAERRVDGPAHFVFAIDLRTRLEPTVPGKYLGNCVGPAFAWAPKKELTAPGAGSLFTACAAVAAAIDDAARGEPPYWERWAERILEASRDDVQFSVAGSTWFRVYGVDFGFGTPAKVEIVSAAKTGAMSMAEDRGGSGGVEFGIALTPERTERLRRCLADTLARLSSSSTPDETRAESAENFPK